jgi:DNA-binding CsgD family transcriptional regulator
LTDPESVIVLTKREQEILHLIKLGKTSKEIADMLFLSELTVKSHRQNMMRKFDVKNVVELLDRTKNRL